MGMNVLSDLLMVGMPVINGQILTAFESDYQRHIIAPLGVQKVHTRLHIDYLGNPVFKTL